MDVSPIHWPPNAPLCVCASRLYANHNNPMNVIDVVSVKRG